MASLTLREMTVLRLCLEGNSVNNSARKLQVSEQTITNNLRSAMRKLGERDKHAAAKRARLEGKI